MGSRRHRSITEEVRDPRLAQALHDLRSHVLTGPSRATAERHLRAISTAAIVYGEAGLPESGRRRALRLLLRASALTAAKMLVGTSMALATTIGLAHSGILPPELQRSVNAALGGLGRTTDADVIPVPDEPIPGQASPGTTPSAAPAAAEPDHSHEGAQPSQQGTREATTDRKPSTEPTTTRAGEDDAGATSTKAASGATADTESDSDSGTHADADTDTTSSSTTDEGAATTTTSDGSTPSAGASESTSEPDTTDDGDEAPAPGRSGEYRRDEASKRLQPQGSAAPQSQALTSPQPQASTSPQPQASTSPQLQAAASPPETGPPLGSESGGVSSASHEKGGRRLPVTGSAGP